MKQKTRKIYGEQGGYDEANDGWEVELSGMEDGEMRFFDALEFFNKPATPTFIAGQIGRLRVTMPRRAEDNGDIEVLIDTMVDDFKDYPADIIAHVAKKWRSEERFFPLIREFKQKLDDLVAFRVAVLRGMENARNPLLAAKKQKQIANDPRMKIYWMDLPKKDWMDCHWNAALEEAKSMLKLARENPSILNLELWENEVKKLQSEYEARSST